MKIPINSKKYGRNLVEFEANDLISLIEDVEKKANDVRYGDCAISVSNCQVCNTISMNIEVWNKIKELANTTTKEV